MKLIFATGCYSLCGCVLLSLVAMGLYGCIGERFAAEVGYHRGTEIAYDIWGDFDSLEECRDHAIARFNQLNRESEGRATSWACLKKNGDGGYERRHR